MRRMSVLVLLTASLWSGACVPSINPLYTDKDVVFDPALIGTWAETGSSAETWTFSKESDRSYRLVLRHGAKSSPFVAHLVQLGPFRFLDLAPHQDGLDNAQLVELYEAALVPAHLFLKVSRIEPTLQMAFLDRDWLNDQLKKSPTLLGHERPGSNELVLTASTRDLQAFVIKHANDKGAFGDESNLTRR